MKSRTTIGWDWISAGLLFVMVQIVAARLVTTEWTSYLYWTETVSGLGTILGLALGASTFRSGQAMALAVGYSAAVLPWQLTRSATHEYILDRLGYVGGILAVSFGQFFQRQPVQDPLFFLAFMCVGFWLMGVTAGYWLGRHGRVLLSIAICGATILIIQAYGDYQVGSSVWLAVFLLVAILLAGRAHFLHQERAWSGTRFLVGEESGAGLLSSLFMTATLAILVAWWIPGAPGSVQRAADTWNTYIDPLRERLSNAVRPLEGEYGTVADSFYASSLALGQNAVSGDAPVLTVEVQQSPGLNMRYYWRGRIYDEYQGAAWSASASSQLLANQNDEGVAIPTDAERVDALLSVTSEFPTQSLMYGPSPTVWIDRAAEVAAQRVAPDADVYDVYWWEATTPMPAGSAYQLRARLRNPSMEELQLAGETYPDWIVESFLDVPEQHRGRLEELAKEITAGLETPYDEASAITAYLRSNIEYSGSIPEAPSGQDPVMWVLFEYKRGFCNYYASAEVLLLRSIGIPARLAVGFARGELEDGAYKVYRRDAHAWPEVFFPDIGWVEFEPTGNQPPLERPTDAVSEEDTLFDRPDRLQGLDQPALPPENAADASVAPVAEASLMDWRRILFLSLMLLVTSVSVIAVWRFHAMQRIPSLLVRALGSSGGGSAPRWVYQWEHWNQLAPVERAFSVVGFTLRLLGRPPARNATPATQAASLARMLPSSAERIGVLRRELENGLFTPQPPDLGRATWAAGLVLLHGVGARLDRALAALDGRAVYSDWHEDTDD